MLYKILQKSDSNDNLVHLRHSHYLLSEQTHKNVPL